MAGVATPNRSARKFQTDQLIKLHALGGTEALGDPKELPLASIREEPDVFQIRQDSLVYAPGGSEAHIRKLAAIVRQGQALDPVKVVAFGDAWFLVDGHHRLEAYRKAKWTRPVPVDAAHSPLEGLERVLWAEGVGAAENKKDRLNVSVADKASAAWRSVVQGSGSKAETARTFGVSERNVATMRVVKKRLSDAGFKPAELVSFGWNRALFEAKRLDGEGAGDFDAREARKRLLAKNLVKALKLRPPAEVLLEVLEEMQPGISIELEAAIANAKLGADLEI